MSPAIKIGLVGAGPWAHLVHGPMLSGGDELELSAIWARRREASEQVAAKFGGRVCADFDELLNHCDAVAFCVPPAVQASLAVRAAQNGKALILEKPIADTLESALRLTDAVDAANVASIVTFSYRFASEVRQFVAETRDRTFRGGRAAFLTSAYLGGPFATEWRLAGGSIIDIGPHAIDLMEQIVGPVERIHAVDGAGNWTALTLWHAEGAITQISLCSHTATDPLRFELDVYDDEVTRTLDVIGSMGAVFGEALLSDKVPIGSSEAFSTLRSEFVECVTSGKASELDVRHGLHVQRLVSKAQESLSTGTSVS